MATVESLGQWVRRRRNDLKLTQVAMAARLACSLTTLRAIEADRSRPSAQLAARLVACLGAPPAEAASPATALTPRPQLPTGTITFLFTDIVASTQLWERYPEAMPAVLARHMALIDTAITAARGAIFKTVGDAVCAAFARAPDAVAAALAIQRTLLGEDWAQVGDLRVRLALHTGVAEETADDYFGPTLNRIARLLALGHGGQILLSRATMELVRERLPTGVTLLDLNTHQLRGLSRPEQVFQLRAPDLPAEFPPLRSPPPPPPAQVDPSTERATHDAILAAVTTAVPMQPTLRLQLFGGFTLSRDGAPLVLSSPRLQALIAYLSLHQGEAQPRRRLAFLLWPDSTESQAHTNLRTLLHRLQSALPDLTPLLQIDAQSVMLASNLALNLDVASFEAALREAADNASSNLETAAPALERAVACYTGDLLPDCYDEWVQPVREQLRERLIEALARLVALYERGDELATAITHARRLASLDPLNEIAALQLVQLLERSGDRAGALRTYHACTTMLQRELGASPGAALHEQYTRLVSTTAAPAAPQLAASPTLVGREEPWRQLQAAWQSAAAGRALLLAITGEAGIGKTHMAEELLRWATRQGIITATAHCYATEGPLAYAPALAWLRAESLRPHLRGLPAPWLAELARLEPDLLAPGQAPPAGALTAPWQRQLLFEALSRAMLAADRPTILLLDDLQWCDRETLEWLHFLLRAEPGGRLLVVGTVRIEELEADHPLAALLDGLRREGRMREVALGPLSRQATAALVTQIAGRALAPTQQDQFYRETEGNPLFIVELVRVGLSELASPGAPPPGVQAVLTRRLQQLTSPSRDLLGVAAVIGRSFSAEVLAQASGLAEDALVRGLDELWQRRIVREQGADAYDFSHIKLREAAYGALGPARRRQLHARVAAALEAIHQANLAEVSGALASHFERAGMREQAITCLQRAAVAARRLYANDEALAHYERAIALAGSGGSAAATLYQQAGEILHLLGRGDDARQAWAQAQTLLPSEDRAGHAELDRLIGNTYRDEYRYAEAERVYRAAEALLAPDEVGARAAQHALIRTRLQIEWIMLHYWRGQVDAMLQLIEEVRPSLERANDPGLRARLHHLSMIARMRHDRFLASPATVADAQAYLDALVAGNMTAEIPSAHFGLGFAQLWCGDRTEAEQHLSRALALAERSGDRSLQGRCLTYLTINARLRGDLASVRERAERSLRITTAGEMYDYIGAIHGNLAWLAGRNGDRTAVQSHGQAALTAWARLTVSYVISWTARWPLLDAALLEGELDTALGHARAMLDNAQQRLPPPLESELLAAIAAAEQGDHATAQRHLAAAAVPARELGYL
jgi:DNA-binding SARP family transcriptional activator/class 3 adenylate cyclase